MAEHTKGPWKWDGGVRVDAGLVEDGKTTSNIVALVYSRFIGESGDLKSNARLIAAAPDLLDALSECEEYFDNRADADCDQDGFIPNEEMNLLTLVRDAIRKAGA